MTIPLCGERAAEKRFLNIYGDQEFILINLWFQPANGRRFSSLIFSPTIWWLDAQKIEKIIWENAFEKKKKKPG